MENSQVVTIIVSILIPNMGMWIYLMKHSKELGILEGVLMKELKLRIKEEEK